ncbi:MAG: synthase subunit F-type H+-transporting ATPase subunit a [Candidatus Parcubacteria bacterium]
MSFTNTAYAASESHEAKEGISVHLNPYVVGHIGDMPITATLLTVWLVMVLLIALAVTIRRKLSLVPTKLQSVAETAIGGGYDYVLEVLGDKQVADKYFPIIATIFIFILGINWIGLIPGVGSIGSYHDGHLVPWLYPGSTDLNITLGLTVVAFFTIEIAGVLGIGLWKYLGKFLNFHSPLAFVIGMIELISELARLVSFSFRLFGNIFAGKTLLLVTMFFVPYILPMPIYAYEIFVGIIQAAVFAILTLFFIKLALEEPH